MTEPREIREGDRVRDSFGDVHTVLYVADCQIWVGSNRWIHPSNVTKVD